MTMKKRILLIVLAVGTVGLAITVGYIMGAGVLMSREAKKTYEVTVPFDTVQFDTVNAVVSVQPSKDGKTRVETYAKAWRPEEIDMDRIVSVDVAEGVLTVTETPFPYEFFGVFPQPYELKLSVYLPQDIYAQWEGANS